MNINDRVQFTQQLVKRKVKKTKKVYKKKKKPRSYLREPTVELNREDYGVRGLSESATSDIEEVDVENNRFARSGSQPVERSSNLRQRESTPSAKKRVEKKYYRAEEIKDEGRQNEISPTEKRRMQLLTIQQMTLRKLHNDSLRNDPEYYRRLQKQMEEQKKERQTNRMLRSKDRRFQPRQPVTEVDHYQERMMHIIGKEASGYFFKRKHQFLEVQAPEKKEQRSSSFDSFFSSIKKKTGQFFKNNIQAKYVKRFFLASCETSQFSYGDSRSDIENGKASFVTQFRDLVSVKKGVVSMPFSPNHANKDEYKDILNARGDIKQFKTDNKVVTLKQIPIEEARRLGLNLDLGPDNASKHVVEIELTDRMFTLYTHDQRLSQSMFNFIEQILSYKKRILDIQKQQDQMLDQKLEAEQQQMNKQAEDIMTQMAQHYNIIPSKKKPPRSSIAERASERAESEEPPETSQKAKAKAKLPPRRDALVKRKKEGELSASSSSELEAEEQDEGAGAASGKEELNINEKIKEFTGRDSIIATPPPKKLMESSRRREGLPPQSQSAKVQLSEQRAKVKQEVERLKKEQEDLMAKKALSANKLRASEDSMATKILDSQKSSKLFEKGSILSQMEEQPKRPDFSKSYHPQLLPAEPSMSARNNDTKPLEQTEPKSKPQSPKVRSPSPQPQTLEEVKKEEEPPLAKAAEERPSPEEEKAVLNRPVASSQASQSQPIVLTQDLNAQTTEHVEFGASLSYGECEEYEAEDEESGVEKEEASRALSEAHNRARIEKVSEALAQGSALGKKQQESQAQEEQQEEQLKQGDEGGVIISDRQSNAVEILKPNEEPLVKPEKKPALPKEIDEDEEEKPQTRLVPDSESEDSGRSEAKKAGQPFNPFLTANSILPPVTSAPEKSEEINDTVPPSEVERSNLESKAEVNESHKDRLHPGQKASIVHQTPRKVEMDRLQSPATKNTKKSNEKPVSPRLSGFLEHKVLHPTEENGQGMTPIESLKNQDFNLAKEVDPSKASSAAASSKKVISLTSQKSQLKEQLRLPISQVKQQQEEQQDAKEMKKAPMLGSQNKAKNPTFIQLDEKASKVISNEHTSVPSSLTQDRLNAQLSKVPPPPDSIAASTGRYEETEVVVIEKSSDQSKQDAASSALSQSQKSKLLSECFKSRKSFKSKTKSKQSVAKVPAEPSKVPCGGGSGKKIKIITACEKEVCNPIVKKTKVIKEYKVKEEDAPQVVKAAPPMKRSSARLEEKKKQKEEADEGKCRGRGESPLKDKIEEVEEQRLVLEPGAPVVPEKPVSLIQKQPAATKLLQDKLEVEQCEPLEALAKSEQLVAIPQEPIPYCSPVPVPDDLSNAAFMNEKRFSDAKLLSIIFRKIDKHLSASILHSRIEDCSGVNSSQLNTESMIGESMMGREDSLPDHEEQFKKVEIQEVGHANHLLRQLSRKQTEKAVPRPPLEGKKPVNYENSMTSEDGAKPPTSNLFGVQSLEIDRPSLPTVLSQSRQGGQEEITQGFIKVEWLGKEAAAVPASRPVIDVISGSSSRRGNKEEKKGSQAAPEVQIDDMKLEDVSSHSSWAIVDKKEAKPLPAPQKGPEPPSWEPARPMLIQQYPTQIPGTATGLEVFNFYA